MLEKKKNRQKGSNEEERNQIERAQMYGQTTKERSNDKWIVKQQKDGQTTKEWSNDE